MINHTRSLLLLGTVLSSPLIAAEKPNILFILCDDLGYGDVGAFMKNDPSKPQDAPSFSTPNIDQLAHEGIQLRAHYSGAPVCAPSRATLFMGMSQGNSPIRNNQFDKAVPGQITIGNVMQAQGYTTALIGKWGMQGKGHDAKSWPAYPTKRGFNYFLGGVRHTDGHEHYPADNLHFSKKQNLKNHHTPWTEVWEQDKEIGESLKGCYSTDFWTVSAKKWIIDFHKKSPNKPFFLFLSFDTPHAATQLPSTAFPKGYGVNGGLQWLGKEGKMINTAIGKPDTYIHPDYREKPWKNVYKRYASSVRRIDNCVADLNQTLKDLGIEKNTLVIFTSDHGPTKESYIKQPYSPSFFRGFGPFTGIKRDCLEGGIRPGAIAKWPGKIPAGTVSESPSQMQDWMATFCDITGTPTPAISDGISILPTLTQKGDTPQAIYTEYEVGGSTPKYPEFPKQHQGRKRGQMQTIRIGDLKALRYNIQSPNQPFEVYNVVKDPSESTNLAGNPGIPNQQFWLDAVSRRHSFNKSAKRPYDTLAVASVKLKDAPKGFTLRCLKSDLPYTTNLPDSIKGKEIQTISTDATTGTCEVTGYFNAPKDGTYTFSMPDGVNGILYLHDVFVLDTDSTQPTTASGTIKLKAGYHPFRLSIRNHGKPVSNALRVQGAKSDKPVPVKAN